MPYIHFYKPVSYRGFGRLIGWIISLFSHRYHHTDMSAQTMDGEVVIVADFFQGKVTTWKRISTSPVPRASFSIPVSDPLFWQIANEFLGIPYSTNELLRAGVPFVSDKDLPGVICSEHVAKTIIEVAKRTGSMQVLARELEEMKPWGKTPRDVYDVVAKHLSRV